MATRKPKGLYYYAGGKRISLVPAVDLVALDVALLAEKLPELLASNAALRAGITLRGDIRLVRRDTLDSAILHRLEVARVTQPVFRHGGATLVALPEIRIEDDSADKLAQLKQFTIGRAQQAASDVDGRLILHPLSNNGRDALILANELVEQFKPTSVSPRFLRVVSDPIVRG